MNFTKNQIKWASEHDWFVSGDASKIVCNEDGIKNVEFTNFQLLREWAGY